MAFEFFASRAMHLLGQGPYGQVVLGQVIRAPPCNSINNRHEVITSIMGMIIVVIKSEAHDSGFPTVLLP